MANNNFYSEPLAEPSTLVELLRSRALRQPDSLAYTFLTDGEKEELSLNYRSLDRKAAAIGAQLCSLIKPGARALLLYPPGLDYIAAFFGCLYAGVVAVPAYPPRLNRSINRLQAIVEDCKPALALASRQVVTDSGRLMVHSFLPASLEFFATDGVTETEDNYLPGPTITSQTLAFLQYTSGSTGQPKGIMLSHANLLHNQRMIQSGFEHTAQSVFVGWLPLYHDMGLIGNVFQPLYMGIPCILMSPSHFLQRPVRWLQTISRYRGTTSGGPNFAYELCVKKIDHEQLSGIDLSSWLVAFNGAEPVRSATIQRFTEKFKPYGFRAEAFYPCYGLAESSLIVSGGLKAARPVVKEVEAAALEKHCVVPASSHDTSRRSLVGCGRSLLDQTLLVVCPATLTRCPPGEVGEIWVAGASVAEGYWKRAEETEQAFRAHLADTNEGPFLRTGDLGFLWNGELFVTGRIKDLIVIRGKNYYPQDIEETVEQSHPALRVAAGAAFAVEIENEERLVIVQEVERHYRNYDLEEVAWIVRQAVAADYEISAQAVVLIKPGRILKTSSGKIRRSACREAFLTQRLEVLHSSVFDESEAETEELELDREGLLLLNASQCQSALESYLQRRAAQILRVSLAQVSLNRCLPALGFDSLMMIELLHHLETVFEVSLQMESFFRSSDLCELAAHLQERLRANSSVRELIAAPAAKASADCALSRGQQMLWFFYKLAPENPAYNIARAFRISQDLDLPALQRALQRLVERHPSLRTTLSAPEGDPVGQVHERGESSFSQEDAAHWEEALLRECLTREARRPFSLERGPLIRMKLYRRSSGEHIMLLSVHHIAVDLWSLAIIADELGRLYASEKKGARASLTPSRGFLDYVCWESEWLKSAAGEQSWSYWRNQLSSNLPALELPTDHPRLSSQPHRGALHQFKLNTQLTLQLKELARSQGSTLYTILLSAFGVLLHHLSDQDEVVVGSPMVNRRRADFRNVVGNFMNPVVLRLDVSGDPTFSQLCERTKTIVQGALTNQTYPFSLLVERLQPKRDLRRPPLFDVMFLFQSSEPQYGQGLGQLALGGSTTRLQLGELTLVTLPLEQAGLPFDLTLTMAATPNGLGAELQYNSNLFDVESITRWVGCFERLLENLVAHPEHRLSELSLLSAAEQRQLLVEWNETRAEYSTSQGVHRIFERQVERTPQRIAVEFEGESLSYAELNTRANQLAHYLQASGVKPEVRVGLCLERSLEMTIALLGILKAGGAYVPLTADYPQERLRYMLEDAGLSIVLTQRNLLSRLPKNNADIICLDRAEETISRESIENTASGSSSQNLAYIIYTSGSTGRPKGVQVQHSALTNFLNSMRQRLDLSCDDALLAITPLSFDISALELYLPLVVGARHIVVSREVAVDGGLLAEVLGHTGATVMQATPATWQMLLEAGWRGCEGLKILCGGETLSRGLAQQLLQRGAALWNLYGPTETAIWSTVCKIKSSDESSIIGQPIDNTETYILNRYLQPVPIGIPGDLYIGGAGLARGYCNDPGLTAKNFIPNPFTPERGCRLYKTGDRARYLTAGRIEFRGRRDYQLKVNGVRIEPFEIEEGLRSHPAVREAVVVSRKVADGDKRLVAYIVPQPPAPSASEMRRFLKELLPEQLIPSAFVMLDALPLTPNGKLNRQALPMPNSANGSHDAYTPPRTQLERILTAVWQDALGHDQVGTDDNFFELGGHSLLLTRVQSRLKEVLNRDVPVIDLLQYPTISSLGEYLNRPPDEQTQPSGEDLEPLQQGRRRLKQRLDLTRQQAQER